MTRRDESFDAALKPGNAKKRCESDFWKDSVKDWLKGTDPVRIENPVGAGTPDVNCTIGWIELKVAPTPTKDSNILRVPHFRPKQRVWLIRRWRADQRAWLLIEVCNCVLLLNGEWAALHLGKVPYQDVQDNAEHIHHMDNPAERDPLWLKKALIASTLNHTSQIVTHVIRPKIHNDQPYAAIG